MGLQESRDPVETMLHGFDGMAHVGRLVSPWFPESFRHDEWPQVGAVQLGFEFAGVSFPPEASCAPPVQVNCAHRSADDARSFAISESVVHEKRKTLVNRGVELRIVSLIDHGLRLDEVAGSVNKEKRACTRFSRQWWSCRGAAPRVRKAGPPLSPGSTPILSCSHELLDTGILCAAVPVVFPALLGSSSAP